MNSAYFIHFHAGSDPQVRFLAGANRYQTGGERQLVRLPFDDDGPLVAVLVRCPSTGGQYALRVPPHIRTCREAVAWIADIDPDSYQPTQET